MGKTVAENLFGEKNIPEIRGRSLFQKNRPQFSGTWHRSNVMPTMKISTKAEARTREPVRISLPEHAREV